MARRPNPYINRNQIEYIGARPMLKKQKRGGIFGTIGLISISLVVCFFFARPLLPYLKATQNQSADFNQQLIQQLASSKNFGDQLAAQAIAYTKQNVLYDNSLISISYPNGDVPADQGNAADLIIRSYRKLGIDLQKNVHEDMTESFSTYPDLWSALQPDSNVDHRRIQNLERYFKVKGQELPNTLSSNDYRNGDIVVWAMPDAQLHIGIVAPSPNSELKQPWVVHHKSGGSPIWENSLFTQQIIGHYRFSLGK